MKQEHLDRLLFALIVNSKRSDRELAKNLRISQPTITSLRRVLEKEAILQYTLIPKAAYLGFDLVAFTFARTKEYLEPFWESKSKWIQTKPNVVFVSTGQGMDTDALIVTIHKSYADFIRFHHELRTECGKYCEEFRTFIISLKGSVQIKSFTYNHLERVHNRESM